MQVFNELSDGWDIKYTKMSNFIRRVELVDVLLGQMPSNLNILDYGCATGFVSRHMARRGHRVTGVDVSEEMLRIAGQKQNDEGQNLKFKNVSAGVNLKDISFDLLLCLNTLEYMSDVEEFFRTANRLLKDKGRLFVTVTNRESFFYSLLRKIYLLNKKYIHNKKVEGLLYFMPHQKNSFKRTQMEELLSQMNFRLDKVLYCSLPLNCIHLNRWIRRYKIFGWHMVVLATKERDT